MILYPCHLPRTCVAHLILLDLITVIFGEQYRLDVQYYVLLSVVLLHFTTQQTNLIRQC